MMKKMNKLATLALAGAMVFGLSSCGGSTTASMTPAEVLAAASENLATVESYHADMYMDMNMTMSMYGADLVMTSVTETTMDMFIDPMKAYVDMRMVMDMGEDYGGETEMQMDYYLADDEGVYLMYSPDIGITSIDTTMFAQMDPSASMELYIGSGADFVDEGVESLDGGDATKYTGVITGDAMEEVLSQSGMMDYLTGMGLSDDGMDIAAIYAEMGDMTISVWVDENGYPVRYDMDMTEMMNVMMNNILASFGEDLGDTSMAFDSVFLTMTISNLNAVEDFELPAEMFE